MLEVAVNVSFVGADGAELAPPAEHVWSDISMKEVNKMEKGLIDILKKLNTISTDWTAAGRKEELGGKKSSVKGTVNFEMTITKDGNLFSWSAFKWPNLGNKEFEFMEGMLDGAFAKHSGKLKKAKVK
jgi:hypothetical protein